MPREEYLVSISLKLKQTGVKELISLRAEQNWTLHFKSTSIAEATA